MKKIFNGIEFLENKIIIHYGENQTLIVEKDTNLNNLKNFLQHICPELNFQLTPEKEEYLARKLYRQLSACPMLPFAAFEMNAFRSYLRRQFD